MEAVFTARQALLATSFFLAIIWASCNSTNSTAPPYALVLNSEQVIGRYSSGLLIINDTHFTGKLFTTFPGTADTSETMNYVDGAEDGIWKKFFPGGKLKSTREFIHGQKTGEYLAWWDNGNKQLQYQFADDEYEGICREWNPGGVMIREMNYKKGHEEGSQKMFYDNGAVRSNYVVMAGRRYGLLGSKNCTNVSDSVFNN